MGSHLLKYVLRYNFGIHVLSFSQIDAKFTSSVAYNSDRWIGGGQDVEWTIFR